MIRELLFSERELISTFDTLVYAEIIRALQGGGVNYRVKATNTGSGNHRGDFLGSIGENPLIQTQYQIFVKKKDIAKAIYFMNQCR